jgi:tRNA pseudouridine38-40 synthase
MISVQRNIRLLIAYDGTQYQGWQRQKESPTIQGVIEDILIKITQRPVSLAGAGRTDSGVHAWGQVASFRTISSLSTGTFESALNALLPKDIVIRQICEVEPGFHARFSCQAKVYDYFICCQQRPNPFTRHYSWRIHEPVDLDLIKDGLSLVIGEHDFASFQSQGSEVSNSVRILYQASLLPGLWGGFKLRFKANGFLRHMVRNMVGTIIRVGLKRTSLKELESILASRDRTRAGEMAPAQGLFLRKVFYKNPPEGGSKGFESVFQIVDS